MTDDSRTPEETAQDQRVAVAFTVCDAAAAALMAAGFITDRRAIMVAFVAQDNGEAFVAHGSDPADKHGLAWAKVRALEELRYDVWRQALATGDPPPELLESLETLAAVDPSDPRDDDFAPGRVWQGKGDASDQEIAIVFRGPSGALRAQRVAGVPEHVKDTVFDVAEQQLRGAFEPTDRFVTVDE